jgi:hypothetical protein
LPKQLLIRPEASAKVLSQLVRPVPMEKRWCKGPRESMETRFRH